MPRKPTRAKPPEKQSSSEWRAASPRARWARIAFVLLGLIVPQIILYGPSLIGAKILLPLDLLADQAHYFPPAPRDSPAPVKEIVWRKFTRSRDYWFVRLSSAQASGKLK